MKFQQKLVQRLSTVSFLGLVFFASLAQADWTSSRGQSRTQRCAHLARRAQRSAQPATEKLFGPLESVKVMSFNLYNLYSHQGRAEYVNEAGRLVPAIPSRPKNEHKRRMQALAILDHKPEFVVVQEVEGSLARPALENLETYARAELDGQYVPFMAEGAASVGKNLSSGFLVRADIARNFDFEVVSHATRRHYVNEGSYRGYRKIFTRDFPVLLMTRRGSDRLGFAIGAVHLKSQRSGVLSHASTRVRAALEVDEIVRIMKNFEKEFPGVPYQISGDFNTQIGASSELEPLTRRLGLRESMSLLKRPMNLIQRTTAFFFQNGVTRRLLQIDGHFLSRHLQRYVRDAWVYRYRDEHGLEIPMPETYADRESALPSDHYPIIVEIDTAAWDRWRW